MAFSLAEPATIADMMSDHVSTSACTSTFPVLLIRRADSPTLASITRLNTVTLSIAPTAVPANATEGAACTINRLASPSAETLILPRASKTAPFPTVA